MLIQSYWFRLTINTLLLDRMFSFHIVLQKEKESLLVKESLPF